MICVYCLQPFEKHDDAACAKLRDPLARAELLATSPPNDGLSASDIKIHLMGLIKRDVSSEGVRPDPELVNGDRKLVTLCEHGSIKMIAVDRKGLLALAADGWVFDDATMAWAHEETR